jgi:hypothetical protein
MTVPPLPVIYTICVYDTLCSRVAM